MKKDFVLAEARRLYDLGFGIHWLRPKSKIPLESGWTTGPRKDWKHLDRTYHKGFNVGVRLGEASAFKNSFLAVIDVDVKSKNPRHRDEALAAARKILGGKKAPVVKSGRGNGSRHYYCRTRRPVKTYDPATSTETVPCYQPSKKASRKELEILGPEKVREGMRLSAAWQVSVYSHGRQVVLPPSIHPDTGKEYYWGRRLKSVKEAPLLPLGRTSETPGVDRDIPVVGQEKRTLKIKPVDIDWLPISPGNLALIKDSTDGDRSVAILHVSKALAMAGLDEDEILTVLTDKKNKLSEVAYEHAKTSDRARAAQWLYKYTARKAVFEVNDVSEYDCQTPAPTRLSEEEAERIANEFAEDRDWRQDIAKNQQGYPLKTVQNIVHIVTHETSTSAVRRDVFACRDTYGGDTPWGGKTGELVEDDDVASIKYWLGVNHGFEPQSNAIQDALIVIAKKNSYDPVKDFMDALPAWDGVPRLDTGLVRYFQAKGDEEYLAQVFKKWMTAMVMRVYRPGAKFDWMPIFEGDQGAGKSSFGEILVGSDHFTDSLGNLHDKDAALALQGRWAIEMAELSQFRRTELEIVKAFISRTVDKIRPPYGKRTTESPRRCVFYGTTNREKYLVDDTGNRRFKPVMVGSLDFKGLKRDRIQLLAEAKANFRARKNLARYLELDGAAREYERGIHQEKMIPDDSYSMEESMRDFIEKVHKKQVVFKLENFRILDLFSGVGPLGGWKKETRNLMLAAKMLRRLGAFYKFNRGRKIWHLEQR